MRCVGQDEKVREKRGGEKKEECEGKERKERYGIEVGMREERRIRREKGEKKRKKEFFIEI